MGRAQISAARGGSGGRGASVWKVKRKQEPEDSDPRRVEERIFIFTPRSVFSVTYHNKSECLKFKRGACLITWMMESICEILCSLIIIDKQNPIVVGWLCNCESLRLHFKWLSVDTINIKVSSIPKDAVDSDPFANMNAVMISGNSCKGEIFVWIFVSLRSQICNVSTFQDSNYHSRPG